MARSHKGQHWIPTESYLIAWADPDKPAEHNDFVHIFSKDGSAHRRRAPDNVFKETDLYTIKGADGARDLRLENMLSEFERSFSKVRRDCIEPMLPMTTEQYIHLIVFVAAMHARTPTMRDHEGGQWGHVQAVMEDLAEKMANATPEQRKAAAHVGIAPADKRRTLSLDDVRQITANPMATMMPARLSAEGRALIKLRALILCTDSVPGFITSDDPVVWYDPEAYKRPPMYRAPGLAWPSIQITFPISPRRLLLLTHGPAGCDYAAANDVAVTEVNRLTRASCRKQFVVSRELVDPAWLKMGTQPDDAWEALHPD